VSIDPWDGAITLQLTHNRAMEDDGHAASRPSRSRAPYRRGSRREPTRRPPDAVGPPVDRLERETDRKDERIEALEREAERLHDENERLREENDALRERLAAVEAHLGLD